MVCDCLSSVRKRQWKTMNTVLQATCLGQQLFGNKEEKYYE